MQKVPFAWRNVSADRQKLLFSSLAISFAVFLMLIQIGFKQALVDSNTAFLRSVDYDLVLISKRRYTSFIEQTFPRSTLISMRAVDHVIESCPLYQTTSIWKPLGKALRRPIRVYAISTHCRVNFFNSLGIRPTLLQQDYTVMADQLSRPEYGSLSPGVEAELDGRRIRIVDDFRLGADFSTDGTLILSDKTFLRLFSNQPTGIEGNPRTSLEQVDFGLIKISQNADAGFVKGLIEKKLPRDVVVLTKDEMITNEASYWNDATPIGFLFNLGTIMGFVVGVLIVRNLLTTELEFNARQYATLKAIGHSNQTLQLYIVRQGVILCCLGLPAGIILSHFVYAQVSKATGLIMVFNLQIVITISILTVLIGVISGILAAQKLANLDPVDALENQS